MKNTPLFAYLTSLLLLCACTKSPDFPIVPELTFGSLSKTSSIQGITNDELSIVIEYTDGDGDLITDNTVPSIFFRDMRDSSTFRTFALPEIPEQGLNNGISGEITMRLIETLGFCCTFPNGLPACSQSVEFPVDTLVFEIYMTDRAGHASNIIRTEPFLIFCD